MAWYYGTYACGHEGRKENLVERFKDEIEKQKDIREWLYDPNRVKSRRKTKGAG